jgi:DNA polymerase epsilon subunit 1
MLGHFDFQLLIKNLDRDLQYAIRVEGKMDLDLISNYDEVKNVIMEKVLYSLKSNVFILMP